MEKESAVRAIGRGLAVLRVINRHGSLNMMAIAKLSAMPYPTACRIVDTLMDEGMVEREPSRKFYRATSLVMALSHGYQPEDDLATASAVPIGDLTKRYLWPISVCSRVGTTMMIRACSHRHSPKTLNMYYPGYTIPILGCSAGMAYLAHCDDNERAMIVGSLTTSQTADESLADLDEVLGDIRRNGFASLELCDHTANPGKTSSLSAPILVDGRCEGTVTLAFFASAVTMRDAIQSLAAPLRETARAIARSLAEKAAANTRRQPAAV